MKKYLLLLLLTVVLSACTKDTAKTPLENLATALEKKDSELFIAQIDMTRYAKSLVDNMTSSSEPLKALDAVGKMLGLGGVSDLFGSVRDMKNKEIERFELTVGTGELELMCKESKKPKCPWVTSSLKNAKITEISEQAAIAMVTTPTNISTWIALSKIGENWKVVGISALKDVATSQAENKEVPMPKATNADEPSPPPPAKEKENEVVRF